MPSTRPRSAATSFLRLALATAGPLALLTACGGGGGHHGGTTVTVVASTFFADVPQTLVVGGQGFQPVGGTATVTFAATTGTPFSGGTSATVDVGGDIVSDTEIHVTSPLAVLCPPTAVPVHVAVTLGDGTVIASTRPPATVVGPSVLGASPQPLGTTSGPMTILGAGFGPPGGTASVRFTATAGTPFAGGTSPTADVSGTIVDSSTISLASPDVAATATANVTVTLPSGSCTASPGPVVAFGTVAVSFSAPADLDVQRFDLVSFAVTVTTSAGTTSLRLLDPPTGATFPRADDLPSGSGRTFHWLAQAEAGPLPLHFEAVTSGGAVARATIRIHLNPRIDRRDLVGDVTGDGKPDLVVAATRADVSGVPDAGAIYVWAGQSTPSGTPTATLYVPGAMPSDRLGSGGMRLVDVTGDGILDVVVAAPLADASDATDSGALYVWKGGPTMAGLNAPDAVLSVTGVGSASELASSLRTWTVGDVTGDGIADVIVGAPAAETSGAPSNAGAVFVWKGGATLAGARQPDATLVSGAPASGDRLGEEGCLLADVSGDGVLDVVAAASQADVGGVGDVGAIFVWKGGAAFSGTRLASATLAVPGAAAGTRLGQAATLTVRLEDVSGDGVADVIAAAPKATVGGIANVGALYVWKGGAALLGPQAPDATLVVPSPTSGDAVGTPVLGALIVADLDDDGVLDVVSGSPTVDTADGSDAGAFFLWKGGAFMAGTRTPTATLRASGALPGDALGSGGARVADVTGDGVLDLVVAAPRAGNSDDGAVYVWHGGPTLSGTQMQDARLAVAGASGGDHLGSDVRGRWCALRFADVTGDGVLDVVVPTPDAGPVDTGAVYVWAGGAGLRGAPAPTATLFVSHAEPGDRLSDASASPAIAADVTGDGIDDLVVSASKADVRGVADAGAIYVFRGGPGLRGAHDADAVLSLAAPRLSDQIAGGLSLGIACDVADVTGDGIPDVVAVAPLADTATLTDVGLGFVWAGGAGLAANAAPTAVLAGRISNASDQLGADAQGGDLLLLADVTGDGKLDVVIGGSLVDLLGDPDVGAFLLWAGGAPITGSPNPTTTFAVPNAQLQDMLGS